MADVGMYVPKEGDADADDESTMAAAEAEEEEGEREREEMEGLEGDLEMSVEDVLRKYYGMNYGDEEGQEEDDGGESGEDSENVGADNEDVDEGRQSAAPAVNGYHHDDALSTPQGDSTDTDSMEIGNPETTTRETSTTPGLSSSHHRTPVPFLLRGTLREYQRDGLDWLANLYEKNLNGILADEMGLGKTIQTIALLAHLACSKGIWGPHLIIVPTSVMLNWDREFKTWCPAFKLLTYYGTQQERQQKRQGWNKKNTFHVVITSYQVVLKDQQMFRRKRWEYLILDEAHHIKNFKSLRWRTLLGFNSGRRLL
ncbi:swr1 complex component, partial [Rhizophlyctis rosea]